MPIRGLFASASANAAVIMAMNSEATVVGMSYARAIGSDKASMPMKCIDQIPLPVASAPPEGHLGRHQDYPLEVQHGAAVTRSANCFRCAS
jgi:hypothetical protein